MENGELRIENGELKIGCTLVIAMKYVDSQWSMDGFSTPLSS